MEQIVVNYEGKPCYPILITQDYEKLESIFTELDAKKRKICIVTDSTVATHFLDEVKTRLSGCVKEVITYTFPAGEKSKTLDVIYEIYDTLIQAKFDRKDILVALGGGVVGDMTGYAAATYLRGIRFVQIPTTLLSMVDSSIGGKTGVDFHAYKNMIGAFHQPSFVYINISTLRTLTEEQYISGMGEIIKHGLIQNERYYHWLQQETKNVLTKELDTLEKMIQESLMIKKSVVEIDPHEKNVRAFLNFGHTIGHAIERHMNFTMLHGDCVAVGAICAAYISCKREYISKEEFKEIENTIKGYQLPIRIPRLDVKDVIGTTQSDKKMEAGKIRFVLLKQVGQAVLDTTVTKEEMEEALNYIMQ